MLDSIHQAVLIKVPAAAAAVSGTLSLFLQSLSPGGISILNTAISILGSTVVALGALALKERYDRNHRVTTALMETHRADGVTVIEREKILDQRVDTIFEELKEFYTLRDRERESSIGLLKDFIIQRDTLISQQRELITAQAATIQNLTPKL